MTLSNKRITNVLIRLHVYAGWSVSVLFACNKVRFSRVMAHLMITVYQAEKSVSSELFSIRLFEV